MSHLRKRLVGTQNFGVSRRGPWHGRSVPGSTGLEGDRDTCLDLLFFLCLLDLPDLVKEDSDLDVKHPQEQLLKQSRECQWDLDQDCGVRGAFECCATRSLFSHSLRAFGVNYLQSSHARRCVEGQDSTNTICGGRCSILSACIYCKA